MPRIERDRELSRRRHRRAKLRKLATKYANSTSQGEKAEIAAKVRKISPLVNLDEYVQTVNLTGTAK